MKHVEKNTLPILRKLSIQISKYNYLYSGKIAEHFFAITNKVLKCMLAWENIAIYDITV